MRTRWILLAACHAPDDVFPADDTAPALVAESPDATWAAAPDLDPDPDVEDFYELRSSGSGEALRLVTGGQEGVFDAAAQRFAHDGVLDDALRWVET